MVRMLSFSSYFLAKKPLKQDPLLVADVTTGLSDVSTFSVVSGFSIFSSVLVIGASDTGFSTVFAAVFGLVVLFALVDLPDAFGFFVAIIPPLFDIINIISYFFVL